MSSSTVHGRMTLAQLAWRHALLAGLVLCYAATAFWFSLSHPVSVHEEKISTLLSAFALDIPAMIFFVLFARLIHLTYVEKDPHRFQTLKRDVSNFVSDRNRMLGGFLATILMASVLITFAQMKNLIPVLNPFSWDEFFMALDKAIHFGEHPYIYAHAVLGWHYAISFFTGIYNLWLFLMYFVLLSACFMRPESLIRMQFLVAFLLTWAIGGNLFATIFSSVGPVYYAKLGLGDAFAGLSDALRQHASTGALTVVDTQALLWSFHTAEQPLNTISAFPSMHVASSVLMALFAARLSRLAGIIMGTFAFGIMIGSVLLAWHYAVDGYAGAVIALGAWVFSGWLVRSIYGNLSGRLVANVA